MAENIVFIGNSNVVELVALHDSVSDVIVDDATVTATMIDQSSANVVGQTWPLAMPHEGSGTYRGLLSPLLELTKNGRYTVKITATGTSGVIGYWLLKVTAMDREV